jgi:hypothetical protein
MAISPQHMTPKQLRDLILYHAANSRFQNVQSTLVKRHFLNTGGYAGEPDPQFQQMVDHHNKLAAKHEHAAKELQKHLKTPL